MSEQPTARLELDPNVITRVIDAAVVSTVEVVNFHFNAVATADLSKPAIPPPSKGMSFRFGAANLTADQRKAVHESWILSKAFQELLRAVRQGLEVAHVITALMGKAHKVASNATVAEFLKPFETKAQDRNFPDLLSDVNGRLATAREFADSYMSLQIAGNCLEHRGGVVGDRETKGKDSFEISIPRMKIFYMKGDAEIELAKGEVVDPGEGKDHAEVKMRIEVKKRSFKSGERVWFALDEFNEIAFACHHLGVQLVAKLPKPVIQA